MLSLLPFSPAGAAFRLIGRSPLVALLPIAAVVVAAWLAQHPAAASPLFELGQLAPVSPPALPRDQPAPASTPVPSRPTREPLLEAKLKRVLRDGKTPYAATVLLEIGSGRVIAIAEHSTRGPAEGLALKAMAPAASIFKLVTSSALLQSGVSPDSAVCTHGGKTRMSPALLVENPRRDRLCATFADVVPQSLNVAIAKLALKHLDPDALRSEATRWGFGERFGDMDPSVAIIPDDPFAFANAAAGFGDVKISAMHGAMIAAAVVQDGLLVPPRLHDGQDQDAARRALPADTAKALKRMMVDTVAAGTGRRAFLQAPRLGASAGGKTGSLADYQTGLETSWFVGFAPADRPAIAVASVVINTASWHVKAPAVAKEALRAYFQAHPIEKPRQLVARK